MTQPPFRIALDLDETLSETNLAVLAFANSRFGWDFTLEALTHHDWWVVKEFGLSREQAYNVFDAYFAHDRDGETIVPVQWAREGIAELMEMWAELHVVTARTETTRGKATREWLSRHLPEIPHATHVHFTNHYAWPKTDKWTVCVNLQASILVDDNPEFLEHAHEAGIHGILLDKPWNRNYEPKGNMVRVQGWHEVPKAVRHFRNR